VCMSRNQERSTLAHPTLIRALTALAAPLAFACSTSGPTDDQQKGPYGFEEVVYGVRQTVSTDGTPVVADGMGQVMDYGRYVPGGRIEVKNLVSGDVRNILETVQDGRNYAKADVE